MVHYYRQKEILEERRRKRIGGGNKFTPLLSKMCRRIKEKNAVYPVEKKAQPTRYWGCEEAGHVLWGCPNRVVQPRRAEAQQVRKVERRKCGECSESNHRDDRYPSMCHDIACGPLS